MESAPSISEIVRETSWTGTYAHGTDSVGGIGFKGRELLKKIVAFNLILDVTHLCDESFW